MIKYSVCTVDTKQIYNFLVENDNAFNPAFSTNVDLKKYSEKLYNNAKLYEAWDNDSLVGLLAVYINTPEKKAFIPYICVKRSGIGTSLFSFFLSNLCNCDCVELEVRKNNLKAIGFYKKMGFVMVSENNEKSQLRKIVYDQDVLVSVSCVTYNHSKYIRQCLDGFLMQKTNFAFEVLIHDDASNDDTADIIREYESKYPDKIKPIYQTENQYSKGISPTFKFNIPRVKGKYIAMCEGDDYWTAPLKLQQQVDFLESNPDYGLVWARAKAFYHTENRFGELRGRVAKDFNALIQKNCIPTLTVMYRNKCLNGYMEYINGNNWKMGDYPLWLYISSRSKIHFMDEVVAVYRVLDESASNTSDFNKKMEFVRSSKDIAVFFAEKERHNNLIPHINKKHFASTVTTFWSYNKKIRFSDVKGYWDWTQPKIILKFIFAYSDFGLKIKQYLKKTKS